MSLDDSSNVSLKRCAQGALGVQSAPQEVHDSAELIRSRGVSCRSTKHSERVELWSTLVVFRCQNFQNLRSEQWLLFRKIETMGLLALDEDPYKAISQCQKGKNILDLNPIHLRNLTCLKVHSFQNPHNNSSTS